MSDHDSIPADRRVRHLYEQILLGWNQRNAIAMASLFTPDGSMIGFDGSQIDTPQAIERHLAPIFTDHPTAGYVARVREIRGLEAEVVLLRAVAGMLPPGSRTVKRELNTIHSLVAIRRGGDWRAALFQSTPAAWHGRPHDSE